MKILYVTELWSALREVLYLGESQFRGMPAFFRVLQALIQQGHDVEMLLRITNEADMREEMSVQIPWLQSIPIHKVYTPCYTGWRKPVSELRSVLKVYHITDRLLCSTKYDLVYGHGPFSEAAGVSAKKHRVPFGQRRYGDTYLDNIQHYGKLRAILSRPSDYWSYRRQKDFMIATNDGTQVDVLYRLLNGERTPYPLYFWHNGCDRTALSKNITRVPEQPYLLYVARIVEWKQQELGIQLVSLLKRHGIVLPLYIAGQKDSETYFDSLMKMAEELGVSEQVQYLGVLNAAEIAAYSQNALACLSFYTPSNLGNVFIEYFTNGGIVLSLDDGSLNDIIKSGENGFLVCTMEEAATVTEQLYRDEALQDRIRQNALTSSKEIFFSWEERVSKEISLLESTVSARHLLE